ncbi:hypothetical protein VN0785_14900 [Helicobacter pylori]
MPLKKAKKVTLQSEKRHPPLTLFKFILTMFYYTIKPFKFQKVVYNENIFEIVDSFILFEGASHG